MWDSISSKTMPWVNDDAPNASRSVVKDSQARNMSTVVVDDTDQISYTENGVVELKFATDMPTSWNMGTTRSSLDLDERQCGSLERLARSRRWLVPAFLFQQYNDADQCLPMFGDRQTPCGQMSRLTLMVAFQQKS